MGQKSRGLVPLAEGAAFERDNWHVLKANQLRAWAARDGSTLDDLEPYLGLDPAIERTGEQMALFGG